MNYWYFSIISCLSSIPKALLLQCMSEAEKLFGYSSPEPVEESQTEETATELTEQPQPALVSFDVNRSNMHHFERILDPSGGHILKEPKMISWFSKFLIKTVDTKPQQAS